MKNGIIIYQSKYGATKKYANWLMEITGFDCIETPKARLEMVIQYESIVLCGGVYASSIAGLSFLKKNFRNLKGKKIAVFCVGASPYDEKALNDIKKLHLKDELSDIPLFYGRGAWNESRMSFKDRTLCKLLQKAIAKKNPNTYEPWMKALMSAVGKSCDWTDKKYLTSIQKYLE
ncbi:flavodoxin domain-containing protein [uncultured Eubacterium sp.]|uniref:flavodoxin domain-containing protein n=1 Tax=uncultured Eubacterium sp. TaxID=165185 RepID=UPI0026730692|nr:flavodoxin domain-containing protein [uncultured Eubacterium sp.]